MHGEFESDATRVANPVLDARGQFHVDAIAGSEIAAGLGDADYRPARLQFLPRDAVIAVTLDVNSGFAGFREIVEPDLAAPPWSALFPH